MSRLAVALVASSLATLAACHLADSPDPVKCDPGTHPFNGHCAVDDVAAVVVTIAVGEAGTSCTVSPDSIKVAPNGQFQFKNEDGVDHTIAGADGQTWGTAMAGQASPFIGITKVGSWPYTVSGCSKGGTVVVE